MKSGGRFGTNSRPKRGEEVMVEPINGSPVEGLQQHLRRGGLIEARLQNCKGEAYGVGFQRIADHDVWHGHESEDSWRMSHNECGYTPDFACNRTSPKKGQCGQVTAALGEGPQGVGIVFRLRGDTGRVGRCATLGVARSLGLSGSRDAPVENSRTAQLRPGWES